jgi:hypothetical protein
MVYDLWIMVYGLLDVPPDGEADELEHAVHQISPRSAARASIVELHRVAHVMPPGVESSGLGLRV